jgi:hypothetical protein
MPSKNRDSISQISVDQQIIADPLTIATKFNEFFTTMPSKIVNEIVTPAAQQEPETTVPPGTPVFCFVNTPVSFTEIRDSVNQLQPKKLQDFNGISMFFVKKVIEPILIPLKHVFHLSLSTGTIPNQLKIAKVIPIFKSGDPILHWITIDPFLFLVISLKSWKKLLATD